MYELVTPPHLDPRGPGSSAHQDESVLLFDSQPSKQHARCSHNPSGSTMRESPNFNHLIIAPELLVLYTRVGWLKLEAKLVIWRRICRIGRIGVPLGRPLELPPWTQCGCVISGGHCQRPLTFNAHMFWIAAQSRARRLFFSALSLTTFKLNSIITVRRCKEEIAALTRLCITAGNALKLYSQLSSTGSAGH